MQYQHLISSTKIAISYKNGSVDALESYLNLLLNSAQWSLSVMLASCSLNIKQWLSRAKESVGGKGAGAEIATTTYFFPFLASAISREQYLTGFKEEGN